MFCPACGSQLPETAKFCLECGVKLSTFAPGVHPDAGGNRTAPIGSPAIAAAAIAPAASEAAPAPAATPSSAAVAEASPAAQGATAPSTGGSTLHGTGSPKRISKTGTSMHGAQVYVDPGDDSVVVPMAGPSRRTLVLGGAGIAVVSLFVGAIGAWRAVKSSRPQTTTAPPLQSESAVALLETPRSLPHAPDPTGTRGGGARNGGRTNGSGSGGSGGAGASGGSENSANTNSGAGHSGGSNGATNGGATAPSNTGGSGGTTAGGGNGRPSSGSGSTAQTGANGSGSTGGTGGSSAGNTAQNGTGGSGSAGSGGGEIGSGGSAGTEVSGTRGPRAPASGGYVEGDSTDATGTLNPSAFTFVYRHYRSQISSCHSSVTRGGQEVNGVLRLRVRIGTDGHVVRTRVLENTTRNEALATCVQNQVRTWRYPQPEGGEVEVDYPFGFGN